MTKVIRLFALGFVSATLVLVASGPLRAANDGDLVIKPSYQLYSVSGDEGRFREDRYTTDDSTGGIEQLLYRDSSGDKDFDLELHSLYDYDYGLNSRVKSDSYYFKVNVRQLRKYYDGSNEAWDPVPYGLTSDFADFKDDDMYADRLDATVELGITAPDMPVVILGWNRWDRDGRELLLRSERAMVTGDVLDRLRSIPAQADVNGESDTFYAELSHTLFEKYDLTLRQEIENYDDNQYIVSTRYKDGVLEQMRNFRDEPDFEEYRTLVMLESFLDEGLYATANYLHDKLENDTKRSVIRPNLANPNTFVSPNVDNEREADTATVGFVVDVTKGLRGSLSFRAEDADTTAKGSGLASGTTERLSDSSLGEKQYAESLSVQYMGLPSTTLSLDVDLEQRELEWKENTDTRSHEIFTDFGGPASLTREADIDFDDKVYTVTALTRPASGVRLVARYRKMDKEHDYTEKVDNSATFYPGILGDQDDDVEQWTLKLSTLLVDTWSAGLEYQKENSDRKFQVQTVDGQDLETDRLSASLMGTVFDDLTLSVTGMAEDYQLNTPGAGSSSTKISTDQNIFDYDGDAFVINTGSTYKLDNGSALSLTYQHTDVSGTVRNDLDEVWVSFKHEIDDNNALELRYEFFDFNDKSGNGFDNYDGHGVYVAYSRTI